MSVSVCVSPICYCNMVTGSASMAKEKIDHHFQSANEQSGIAAGSGGFDIRVKGNTDLQGGAITSSAAQDKNHLSTASLSYSDLTNTQVTQADSESMSAGYGGGSLGVKMVRELQKGGLTEKEAIDRAQEFLSSGTTAPVARPLDVTDRLVKVVPAGGSPSASTGYWMTEGEFIALKSNPASMANKLGLPPGMHADAFDVFQITPRSGALVFESTIAPTTVGGSVSTIGGAKQTIVVDRTQFTPPVKVGTIQVK